MVCLVFIPYIYSYQFISSLVYCLKKFVSGKGGGYLFILFIYFCNTDACLV
jgi:hypothetical protein